MTEPDANRRMMTFHVPEDQNILILIGMISLRHSHLDYILRMTVKTLADTTINEALDATRYQGSSQLRRRILKLARQRLGEGQALVKLEALIGRCDRATEKRNRLIHNIWAKEPDGEPLVRNENHEWEPTPGVAVLDRLADELLTITQELNKARLDGFLHEALHTRSKS